VAERAAAAQHGRCGDSIPRVLSYLAKSWPRDVRTALTVRYADLEQLIMTSTMLCCNLLAGDLPHLSDIGWLQGR
jgi:hypothetical protein